MKEEELSSLSTFVPCVEHVLSIQELVQLFKEKELYGFFITLKDGKPIGWVKRRDAFLSLSRQDLTAGDLTKPLTRVRNTKITPENIPGIFDFFNAHKDPLILVDKGGKYLGVIFYQVLLHYISTHQEASFSIFQKLRNLLGQPYYLYVFFLKGIKAFREAYGSAKEEGLYKILYEDVSDYIKGDVSLLREEGEIYALSKDKLRKEDIKEIIESFHRDFSLLYADAKPVYVHGYMIPLEGIKTYEELFKTVSEIKDRLTGVDASFFILHGLQPSVIMCEYRAKEVISKVKDKITEDFKRIVERISQEDKELWEYVLYDFFKEFPYFELFYIMNDKGIQVSNNVVNPHLPHPIKVGKKGADRSEKPYFKQAMEKGFYVSEIYLSQATDDFCITLSAKFSYGKKDYVLAGDINYREIHKIIKSYLQAGALA